MSYGDSDAIAAIATPLGVSALALIRTSGEGVIELLAKVFSRAEKLIAAKGNTLVHGWITEPNGGKKIDEVVVSVYRAPRSYTGEDCADISCHGGIAVVGTIMTALRSAGFREALGGEFTFRAFMNGKLDLTRAESVMELVSAKTNRGRELAVRRLSGALEKEISEIKKLLVEVLAKTEIYLDYSEDEFPDDDDESAGRLPERNMAEEAAKRLKTLAENWHRERIYTGGVLVAIAGKPNAGKSSLFNYLVMEDRSIVTDTPGTTRDWIEALVSIGDIPLRLTDTAGLRRLDSNLAENTEAERIGITRSVELLEKADLVLYVIDGAEGITAEDSEFLSGREGKTQPILVLWNKCDIALPPSAKASPTGLLALSAMTGEGISSLTGSIIDILKNTGTNPLSEETAGPGTIRQKELIDTALASVEEALAVSSKQVSSKQVSSKQVSSKQAPLDIIAPFFRAAVNALGEITGEVSGEDIFEIMFSKFCVGK